MLQKIKIKNKNFQLPPPFLYIKFTKSTVANPHDFGQIRLGKFFGFATAESPQYFHPIWKYPKVMFTQQKFLTDDSMQIMYQNLHPIVFNGNPLCSLYSLDCSDADVQSILQIRKLHHHFLTGIAHSPKEQLHFKRKQP